MALRSVVDSDAGLGPIVIERLPRLMWRCMSEVPSTMGQVISRM